MSLTIAIDAFRIVAEPLTSGAIYVAELVKSLSRLPEIGKLYLLLPRRPNGDFLYGELTNLQKVECIYSPDDVFPERNLCSQIYWIQWIIARLIRTKLRSIDYYIAPYHHPPVFLPKRVRVVTVIHDLCGLRADCGYSKTKKGFYRHLVLFLIASIRSNSFVPISVYTSDQLKRSFPFLSARVSNVVYNGINTPSVADCCVLNQTLEKFALRSNDYFLAFGNSGIRKGLDLTLGAYVLYKARGGNASLALIVAGQSRDFVTRALRGSSLEDVVLLSDISGSERDALYRGAVALLFPSRCEGFGYPILEAMRQGCPPIAWRDGPAPEIVNGVVPLIEKLEIEEIGELMEGFRALDLKARAELGEQLIRRSLFFTGDRFGVDFFNVLQRVAC